MRALLLFTLLGSTAAADPVRTLETLVKRGRLEAKVVARELVKLQPRAKFKQPLAATSCVLTSETSDLVFRCSEVVCAGACRVRRNEATIRVRGNTWTVTAAAAKDLGDTGACGCCL